VDRDDPGLQVLTRQDCLALLGTVRVGRLVFTARALPAVRPVGFSLAPEGVLLQVAAGSGLARAVSGTVVAFEADEFDPELHRGWTVTVTGRVLRPPALRAGLPGGAPLVLPLELVDGRRVGAQQAVG